MVVFTCNHCGDAIQKPKVDRHITFECKKKYMSPSLCCIDCLKDFNIQSYVQHTRCVTELERYSRKGYVPKSSENKGLQKQNTWFEVIQEVLLKPGLSKGQKCLLDGLKNFENVPRKKFKFQNFIENAMKGRRYSTEVIESVFDLLSAEFKSVVAPPSDASETKKSPEMQEVSENLNNTGEFQIVERKKKKKKEHEPKSKDEEVENDEESKLQSEKRSVDENFDEYDGKGLSRKKQKKLKINKILENSMNDSKIEENSHLQDSSEVEKYLIPQTSSEVEDPSDINATKLSKKERKDLKKKLKQEGELKSSESKNEIVEQENVIPENLSVPEIDVTNLSKKEKKELKKKLKYEAELKSVSESKIDDSKEEIPDKKSEKKDKKRKFAENGETEEVIAKKVKIEEIIKPVEEENTKFSWEDVIKTLLEKAHGNEMSLKKLSKKTVAEYQAFYSSTKSYEDIVKRFHKKVNKLPFVKVLKDKAKLCSLE